VRLNDSSSTVGTYVSNDMPGQVETSTPFRTAEGGLATDTDLS